MPPGYGFDPVDSAGGQGCLVRVDRSQTQSCPQTSHLQNQLILDQSNPIPLLFPLSHPIWTLLDSTLGLWIYDSNLEDYIDHLQTVFTLPLWAQTLGVVDFYWIRYEKPHWLAPLSEVPSLSQTVAALSERLSDRFAQRPLSKITPDRFRHIYHQDRLYGHPTLQYEAWITFNHIALPLHRLFIVPDQWWSLEENYPMGT